MKQSLRRFAALTLYLGLVLQFFHVSSQEVICSNGWSKYGTSCYYVYADASERLSFWKAKRWCKAHSSSSRLTSVHSEGENQFLDHLINETRLRSNETFYIGLRFRNQTWKWIDNQPLNYTNWFQDTEPTTTNASGTHHCVYYSHVHQWQWEEKCATKRLFVCKEDHHQQQQQQRPSTERVDNPTQESIPTPSLPDDITKKLNELLSSLENATFNDTSAEKQMKVLGAVLDDLFGSNQSEPGPQAVAHLSNVVEMGERIGELIVKGLKRGGNITEPKTIQIQTSNLVLGVDILPPVLRETSTEGVTFPRSGKTTNKINLPASLIRKAQQPDGVSITSLLLPNVGASADPQAKRILNSGIISSTILFSNGSKFNNLTEPVEINLSQVNKVKVEGSRSCVFLDVTAEPPFWSSSGCVVHRHEASYTQCHCYHMTSYAVLMDVHGAYESGAISDDHKLALTTISIVGCLIAFVCYIILLCTFYFLRRRTETSAIHMNLVVAEIFAILIFLVAYPAVNIREACFAVAVALYYFQLASFCWMLVEGINLLHGLVKVFRVTSRLRIYSLFAWGLPAVLAAVIPSVFRHQYLRDNFCWLSHKLIWAFAGPVACFLVVNLIVLLVAMKIVVRRARYKVKPLEKSTMSTFQVELRAAFKTTVILVPLLGLTWIFGFISIHNKSLVFQYLFAVVNSVQGFYFLVAQYFFDDDIKRNANRASNRMKRLFSLSSTKSSRASSDPRPGTPSYKQSGSLKRHNLISPQERIGSKDESKNNLALESAEIADEKQGSDKRFHESNEKTEERQNRESSDVAQKRPVDLKNHTESLGDPLPRGVDHVDGNNNHLSVSHERSADQQTHEDNLNSLLCQTSEDQQNNEESPRRLHIISKDQENNIKDSVPAEGQDNQASLESQCSVSEDRNTTNFSSPQGEQESDGDKEESKISSCQNNEHQLQTIDNENLVSSEMTNKNDDESDGRGEQNDTRF